MVLTFDVNAITVSGVGVPINGFAWPSGQFGSNEPGSQLCAFLTSLNASFGFNIQPNNLSTEWIPCGDACLFHGASGQLPNIGKSMEINVGDFYFKGIVTHADYTSSNNGTVVKVTLEDNRKTFRRVKIHTEDLGEDVPSGIVSVARAYRKVNGIDTDSTIREYERILKFGASYDQILAAIDLAFNEGRIGIPVSELPSTEQLARNIDGGIESIRWQFNLSPLDEAMTRILQDHGFDWYWIMDSQKLGLINKRVVFDPSESDLLDIVSQFGSASGLNETKQIAFGQDIVPDPTRFRVLGGHQQGFLNSEHLGPIDGLDTTAVDPNVIFTKAWDRLTIGFYDFDGFYRTYIPAEKELQVALAGIEQWTYYKKYQTNSTSASTPGFAAVADPGSVAAQNESFGSRLDLQAPIVGGGTGDNENGFRVISNRRDEEHNWVIAWYNRVRDHANRHYGRTYTVENILFNSASGLYRLLDSAWANVENQVQGFTLSPSGSQGSGIFTEDYEISRSLGPISPFVTDDFRVSAYAVLPANTVYGPQGDGVPASFGNWTEDAAPFNPTGDGRHYIPIDLRVVGQRVIDPRNDDLYSFEAFPEGTLLCQLPINAGPSTGVVEEPTLANLATLLTTRNKLSSSGTRDVINPANILNVYQTLTGVAIPVEARSRYGQTFPTSWVAGVNHFQRDEDVQLDDQFVPWAFSPAGSDTSIEVMTTRAYRRAVGKIVPRSSSRYADFTQVGLPLLTFDSFADQGIGPSGFYGEIAHGVNELNINFGIQGFTTRYKVQSYFPRFGKDAPLGDRNRAILNGIINPINFTDLELGNQRPAPSLDLALPGDDNPIPLFFDEEKRAVRVTINNIENVFTLSSTAGTAEDERYRGLDQNLYQKPPTFGGSSNKDFSEGAICVDGFLNIGDEALYHVDNFELPNRNVVQRYFTQGRSFGNGTIVEIARAGATAGSFDVTIVDPTSALGGITRAVFDLAPLNGTVSVGDKTTLAAQGDAAIKPGVGDGGVFLNPAAAEAGAGVTPVEIIAVSGQGTPSATAVCKPLDSLGQVILSGVTIGNVVIMPIPQFAASGDQGFLATLDAQHVASNTTVSTSYVHINKSKFVRFRTG